MALLRERRARPAWEHAPPERSTVRALFDLWGARSFMFACLGEEGGVIDFLERGGVFLNVQSLKEVSLGAETCDLRWGKVTSATSVR